jgi:hypothetical protein
MPMPVVGKPMDPFFNLGAMDIYSMDNMARSVKGVLADFLKRGDGYYAPCPEWARHAAALMVPCCSQ